MYDKEYYHPEHYVPKSIMQKMATPCLKKELQQLHTNNMSMTAEESELEFLKVTDTFLWFCIYNYVLYPSWHRIEKYKQIRLKESGK